MPKKTRSWAVVGEEVQGSQILVEGLVMDFDAGIQYYNYTS